ncbi:TadE/TadG family type IV pilus assembly protein [Streptomyces sp. NBC_01198]|uniref:TadE/TadG family type IV pilus assembly protein n=1 Tax=Streptomyces sp. NBC_01198 TaxID=2903769 RepID=UPI002E12E4A4|nr:pilus assembly protein [Streptomyces sp. NBC_01198]
MTGPSPRQRRRQGMRGQRGVASLEYLGMLPFLLLIALAGIQLGLVAYCGEQAGTAARTAARTAALPDPDGGTAAGQAAGRGAVSDWLNAVITWPGLGDAITAKASVDVPSVLPGVHLFGPVSRTATMPKEDTTP